MHIISFFNIIHDGNEHCKVLRNILPGVSILSLPDAFHPHKNNKIYTTAFLKRKNPACRALRFPPPTGTSR